MDPDQTAPTGVSDLGRHCLSIFKWTTKPYILCLYALRVNKYEFSVYTVRIFTKYTHVCTAQTIY